jgi:outer membrane protein TolC
MAHDQFLAGSLSNLDLLTTEQALVAADAAVAASDSVLIQDQIAVFKALGGGWQGASPPAASLHGGVERAARGAQHD